MDGLLDSPDGTFYLGDMFMPGNNIQVTMNQVVTYSFKLVVCKNISDLEPPGMIHSYYALEAINPSLFRCANNPPIVRNWRSLAMVWRNGVPWTKNKSAHKVIFL